MLVALSINAELAAQLVMKVQMLVLMGRGARVLLPTEQELRADVFALGQRISDNDLTLFNSICECARACRFSCLPRQRMRVSTSKPCSRLRRC